MNQAGRAFRRGADEQTSSEAKSKDILKAQLEAEREIQLLTLKQQEDEENAKLRQHAEATDKRTAELARIEKLPLDELREELARRNVALPSDEQPREALEAALLEARLPLAKLLGIRAGRGAGAAPPRSDVPLANARVLSGLVEKHELVRTVITAVINDEFLRFARARDETLRRQREPFVSVNVSTAEDRKLVFGKAEANELVAFVRRHYAPSLLDRWAAGFSSSSLPILRGLGERASRAVKAAEEAAARWSRHAEANAKETLVKIAVVKARQDRQEWFQRSLCCGLVWPAHVPSEEERAKDELARRAALSRLARRSDTIAPPDFMILAIAKS